MFYNLAYLSKEEIFDRITYLKNDAVIRLSVDRALHCSFEGSAEQDCR